mmetsp:Transcript_26532/g.92244  ORF Transcript_26532/g.92244 Transcript_26532/m.92244 type:complete len:238 (-) Transcript_26532:173-886(-)|eukprot:CAMPEP_0203819674 /NCGR_PEP_ID=MMETSP0115-20131106/36965_1 /ASSEMBLY_ACC=CAM_ASM_000227 /TAXON_ID=33651 /ORGANISM="Bicosoecid sp, Strain ms1" /LENGTH=237 /DNA_ID=CAMNT_0050728661 /DNA_START=76 /DNA_END=789 /DNA_ORIENTATION=-
MWARRAAAVAAVAVAMAAMLTTAAAAEARATTAAAAAPHMLRRASTCSEYSCESCTNAGCNWCSSSATCYSGTGVNDDATCSGVWYEFASSCPGYSPTDDLNNDDDMAGVVTGVVFASIFGFFAFIAVVVAVVRCICAPRRAVAYVNVGGVPSTTTRIVHNTVYAPAPGGAPYQAYGAPQQQHPQYGGYAPPSGYPAPGGGHGGGAYGGGAPAYAAGGYGATAAAVPPPQYSEVPPS